MYRDTLYYVYSKPLTKLPSLLLSSFSLSSKSSCILQFFILFSNLQFFYKISYFVISVPLPSFFFFLWLLAILCYMSVYIAVEAFRLSVLVVIVFELSNVHGCFSSTTSGFYSCLTDVIATFHFLSVFGATISEYPNIVLVILLLTFFFNMKIYHLFQFL